MAGNDNWGGDEESGLPLLDIFSDVDNLVRENAIPLLEDIRSEIRNMSIDAQIENLTIEESESDWEAPSFSARTDAATDDGATFNTVIREMPFDGRIEAVSVGFPDGSDEWVGMKVMDEASGEHIFPSNAETDYFAGNDYYDKFNVTYEVEKGQEIAVEYKNNDVEQDTRLVNCILEVKRDNQ